MKNKFILIICFLMLCSHDMYLKIDSYFLNPSQDATINLYNGTFEKSENTIDRSRMLDVSIVGNGNREKIADGQWTEKDSITILNFNTGKPGTYLAGVSTAARDFEMKAEDFNNYLKHDGVLDMLESRTNNDELASDAFERYSKHVKAIFQVGDKITDDWSTELGYPIEFIPLSNPYALHTGDTLQVKLLRDGRPLADQLVYADYRSTAHGHSHGAGDHNKDHEHTGNNDNHEHSHDANDNSSQHQHSDNYDGHKHNHQDQSQGHDKTEKASGDHSHTNGQKLRTDKNGIVTITLNADGIWFLRTIHLVYSKKDGLTHESNWATLTFEITHSHEDAEGEAHSHNESDGISTYVFWIVSILVVGLLFFFFNRKRN